MNAQATMRRKLEGAQAVSAARDLAVLKALRLAVARASESLCELPLAVIGARQGLVAHDDLVTHLPADRLLILLEGPGGSAGAATLSLSLVSALIQQQTMHSVSRLAPVARRFTGTDAAMCAPLVEGLLTRAAVLVEVEPERLCLTGRRYGALAEDARALVLALEAQRFRHFQLTLDIASGLHQGELSFLLPEPAPPSAGEEGATGAAALPGADSPLLQVQAELTAVLCKLRIPLADLAALKAGDLLALPPDRLKATQLVAMSGQIVSTAILGQMNGNRAVKLTSAGGAGRGGVPRQRSSDTDDTFEQMQEPVQPPPAGLPAPAAEDDMDWPDLPPMSFDQAEEADPDGDGLSPDRMAFEISELAGLEFGSDSAERGGNETDVTGSAI